MSQHVKLEERQQPLGCPYYLACVRHYLARPDPVAWLAAADACLESGYHSVAANLWRKRGLWWPVLHPALKDCLGMGRTRQVALGGWNWCFIRRAVKQSGWEKATGLAPTRYVRVYLSKLWDAKTVFEFRIAEKARDRTYWTGRLLEMIDHVPDLTAARAEEETT